MSHKINIHANDIERITDAIESIDLATKYYTSKDKATIKDNSEAIDSIAWRAAIVGEALSHVSYDFQKAHPETEWRKAIANRNFLIHDYSRVVPEVIINTLAVDFPKLRAELAKYRSELIEIYGDPTK